MKVHIFIEVYFMLGLGVILLGGPSTDVGGELYTSFRSDSHTACVLKRFIIIL